MPTKWTRTARTVRALIGTTVAVVLAAAALTVFQGPAGTRVTAYFTEAIGVYVGSDVRVLGVKVGSIDSVEPEGTRVRATMTVDNGVNIPAGANAVVVAASVVSDRYIQLAPAYTGGPKLTAGAVIPVERTATPVEVDKLYETIKKLTADLGPNGLDRNGALSGALRTGAANLRGNGENLGTTIDRLGKAARTLTGSQDDLFATIANLQKFTAMLRDNDGQVRLAERQLAEVAAFLAEDRENLAASLDRLAEALGMVRTFISDNRALLKSNVGKLAAITRTLVDQRRSLAEALDVLPLSVGNVLNGYDPSTQTLMGRGNLNELSMGGLFTSRFAAPASTTTTAADPLCGTSAARTGTLAELCRKRQGGALAPQNAAGTLPPLPLPTVGTLYGSSEPVPNEGGR